MHSLIRVRSAVERSLAVFLSSRSRRRRRLCPRRPHRNRQTLVGKVIDAALGAGATNIGALGLYASSTDTARREAITKAVTKARAEAEAAAVAAGGSLGPMIEFTIDPYGLPRPFDTVVLTSASMPERPMPTPIETGELVVQAVVRAKWQFVAR